MRQIPVIISDNIGCLRQGADLIGRMSGDQGAPSTIVREPQFLLSHTVHHVALISTMNSISNIATPEKFGIAPSTLAYRRKSSG